MRRLVLLLALLAVAGLAFGCTSDGTNQAVYTHPSAGWPGLR